ncbi:MAG: MFS transporter [Thermoplasmataceae archaeon]
MDDCTENPYTLSAEQLSPYRWVMAAVAGLVMTTSFISLTSFSIAAPSIAINLGVGSNTIEVYGVDAFSIGLFAAFFVGHGGIFDTRLRTGVLLAQAVLIIPQFLIPIASDLYTLTLLRFFQGLTIMMIALFTIQLSGWFRQSERARSLAFTLGAVPLGSAVGALLSRIFDSMSWQETYYVTGVVMLAGAAVYFAFAKSPKTQYCLVKKAKSRTQGGAWENPMTWVMGALQIPLTWTLFTIGGFLPTFSNHIGYDFQQTNYLIIIWGTASFVTAFIGAIAGDLLARKGRTNREIFDARVRIIAVADCLMGVGALLIVTVGGLSFQIMVLAILVNAFLMMIPPNLWASTTSVFPLAMMGAGTFGMGLISNSADAIGPLVSSFLVPDFGWDGVFLIMAIMSFGGAVLSLMVLKMNLKLAPDSQNPELRKSAWNKLVNTPLDSNSGK